MAGGKVVDGAGVEQQRRSPIDSDRVARDEARVPSEETDAGTRLHGGVRLADHELVVVVDGDGRRAMRDRHLGSGQS